MHHLQPVAWVLATSLEAAKRGANRVDVEYRPLAPILTIEEAVAGRQLPRRARFESVMAIPLPRSRAAISGFRGELSIGGQEHFYLETQCALSALDESGGIVVDSSTQHPAKRRTLWLELSGLRGIRSRCNACGWAALSAGKRCRRMPGPAIAALGDVEKKGKPVRVRLPRHLDMALTGKRHPFLARFHVGFRNDGAYSGTRVVTVVRWRLESRSFRTDHVARTVPLR